MTSKQRTYTEVHFIEFLIEVVQQYGTFDDRKGRKFYVHNCLSVLESAFWTLYEYRVIKDPEKVRMTEIKKFNKKPYETPQR